MTQCHLCQALSMQQFNQPDTPSKIHFQNNNLNPLISNDSTNLKNDNHTANVNIKKQPQQKKKEQNAQLQQQKFLAVCCKKRCNKSYCLQCINSKFDQDFTPMMYRADTWICYSCQALCPCILCHGIGHDKKVNRKKTGLETSTNKPKLDNKKDSHIKINDYFSKQQLANANPMMRHVMQNKNMQYRLILQNPDHPQHPQYSCSNKDHQNQQENKEQPQKIANSNINSNNTAIANVVSGAVSNSNSAYSNNNTAYNNTAYNNNNTAYINNNTTIMHELEQPNHDNGNKGGSNLQRIISQTMQQYEDEQDMDIQFI